MFQKNTSTKLGLSFDFVYALIFGEYHGKCMKHSRQWQLIRFLWIVTCMFVTMAFMGTLKSTFIRQDFQKRTETLNEMVDKDTKIHVPIASFEYLKRVSMFSVISKRIADQVNKTDGVFDSAS